VQDSGAWAQGCGLRVLGARLRRGEGAGIATVLMWEGGRERGRERDRGKREYHSDLREGRRDRERERERAREKARERTREREDGVQGLLEDKVTPF